jgi:hypothetical protein
VVACANAKIAVGTPVMAGVIAGMAGAIAGVIAGIAGVIAGIAGVQQLWALQLTCPAHVGEAW